MGGESKIEWTDATWNPTIGCSVVSAGCANCYAMRLAPRVLAGAKATAGVKSAETVRMYSDVVKKSTGGRAVWTGKINLGGDDLLTLPMRWTRPRRIFVNSMSDLFHEDIPVDFVDSVFSVMKKCPQHIFQILTKRPRHARQVLDIIMPRHGGMPRNVWLGTSAENSAALEERLPELWEIKPRPAVLFLSAEPLLGRLFCGRMYGDYRHRFSMMKSLDWVIVGGESGPGARPMELNWAREVRDACLDIPKYFVGERRPAFFFKQWGEWNAEGKRVGKKKAGRLLEGREWNEMPEVA